MNEGPIKPHKAVAGGRIGTPDQVHDERKKQIFEALQKLVAEEKAKDPHFDLTRTKVDELVAANTEMFPPGINTGAAVTSYWKVAGFNYLKEKLGFTVKKRRDDY